MSAITRQTVSLLTAVGIGVGVAACAQSTAQDVSSAPVAPAASPVGYDISNIDALAGEFPAGFTVQAGLAKTLSSADVQRAGTHVLTEAQLSPAHCLPMIIPTYAHPTVGTQAAGLTASGEQGGVQVTALSLPEAVPAAESPAGCERVTVSGDTSGVAERVPAPAIDGVVTTAVKLIEDGQQEAAHYIYTAALSDRTVVVVRSGLDAAANPQQFLSGLLVKAVSAVKGSTASGR